MSEGYAPNLGLSGPVGPLDPDFMEAFAWSLQAHEGRLLTQPRFFKINTPAAGADFQFKTEVGRLLIPLAVRATFVASGIAASRASSFTVGDGTNTFYEIPVTSVVTAGLTVRYNLQRGFGINNQSASTVAMVTSWPAIPIIGGQILASLTAAIDAGDQWSGVSLYAIEVRERTPNERAQYMEALAGGVETTDEPGLLLGL